MKGRKALHVAGLSETPAGHAPEPDDERAARIAEAAYFRASQRGFEGGDPVEDWLDAEREIDGGRR